jgi:hypothetical protein
MAALMDNATLPNIPLGAQCHGVLSNVWTMIGWMMS